MNNYFFSLKKFLTYFERISISILTKFPLYTKDNDIDWSGIPDEYPMIKFLSNQTGTIGGSFKDIGRSSEVTGALLALNENEISNALTTYNTVCIIKVNSKDE